MQDPNDFDMEEDDKKNKRKAECKPGQSPETKKHKLEETQSNKPPVVSFNASSMGSPSSPLMQSSSVPSVVEANTLSIAGSSEHAAIAPSSSDLKSSFSSEYSPYSPESSIGRGEMSKPVFEFRFDMNKKEFQLIISTDRPKTAIPSSQGDHITAYAVFLEIIYAAVQDEPISSVVNILNRIARIFLYEDASSIAELETKINKSSDFIQENTVDNDKRKEITKKLRESGFPEEDVKKIKSSLKNDYYLHLISLICDAGRFFIQRTNIMPDIARIRTEEIVKLKGQIKSDKEKSVEGKSTEKESLRALKAYNELIRIIREKDDEKKKSLFEDFQSDDDLCSGLRDTEAVTRFHIDINKEINIEALEKIELFAPIHIRRIGYFIEGLFDYIKLDSEETLEQVEILYSLAARHIAFIFTAFKYLCEMKNEQKIQVIEHYLNYVMKHQGWSDIEYITVGGDKTILKLDDLTEKVILFIKDKGYSDLIFLEEPAKSVLSPSKFSSSMFSSSVPSLLSAPSSNTPSLSMSLSSSK
ncbi:MAG: hypothetical protein K0R48_657 [Gammaproteobacteria bacterium]|nr:hypothetical protein [Gammaproteobacteria bacterium]